MQQDELYDRVCRTAAGHALFPAGAPCVLMVSGGSDSTALARIVVQLSARLGIGALEICHVNHMARGKASDGDALFVEALASQLGIAFRQTCIDVPAIAAAEGGNFEAVARRERYAWASQSLDELCDREGMPRESGRLVTGHTADDRVEAFYMRTIKGFGPGGLAGMRHLSGRVARPLLDVPRSELRSYLLGIPELSAPGLESSRWREDETNLDTTRLRAYVRERIVPAAREANPAFYEVIGRSMDLVADEEAMLSAEAADEASHIAHADRDGAILLDTEAFSKLALPMRRRVVGLVLEQLCPPEARIESGAIDSVASNLEAPLAKVLPCGITVRSEYGSIAFVPPAGSAQPCGPEGGAWLCIPGTLDMGDGVSISAEVVSAMPDKRQIPADCAYVDVGDAEKLWVRPWCAGDRMAPLGMDGKTRKISDILVDEKVPSRLRGRVPVVFVGNRPQDGVVWLAGVRIGDYFKVSQATERLILLRLHIV